MKDLEDFEHIANFRPIRDDSVSGFLGWAVNSLRSLLPGSVAEVERVQPTPFIQDIMQASDIQGGMQPNVQHNLIGDIQGNVQGNAQSNVQSNANSNVQGNVQPNIQHNIIISGSNEAPSMYMHGFY